MSATHIFPLNLRFAPPSVICSSQTYVADGHTRLFSKRKARMTALSLLSPRNGQVGSLTGVRAVLMLEYIFLIGNVSRHAEGCEPSRPSRMGQRGAVQLGAVSWARHLVPPCDVLPLHRGPPRMPSGRRTARARANRGGPMGRVLRSR